MKLTFPKLNSQKPTISAILWALCVGIIVLEIFTLHKSFQVLSRAKSEDTGARPSKSVRINFETYNQAVDRITKAEEYQSSVTVSRNPFLTQDAIGK